MLDLNRTITENECNTYFSYFKCRLFYISVPCRHYHLGTSPDTLLDTDDVYPELWQRHAGLHTRPQVVTRTPVSRGRGEGGVLLVIVVVNWLIIRIQRVAISVFKRVMLMLQGVNAKRIFLDLIKSVSMKLLFSRVLEHWKTGCTTSSITTDWWRTKCWENVKIQQRNLHFLV